MNTIDVNFDFQAEAYLRFEGKYEEVDSDRWSPTLQEYHRILWSKQLPNGKMFTLEKINQNRLYHKSELGEFYLSSDRAVTTFSKKGKHIISQMPKEEFKTFSQRVDSIGGIIIWPSNRINGKMTINGIRGFNRQIADRFDLTIECVRLYYQNDNSPLYDTFKRYDDFFSLFCNFKEYIEFFHLQDIVSDDYTTVKIATPFDDFKSSPIPNNLAEYFTYMDNTMKFVEARNARIANLYRTSTDFPCTK